VEEAFRWTAGGGGVGLGDFDGGDFKSRAYDVSSDGAVIVGYGDQALGREAFRWTDAVGMEGLGDLPGGDFDSLALGVSADGSVVVGRGTTAAGNAAFIWDETNGMRNFQHVLQTEYGLDLTGWALTSAKAVSSDGLTIVGDGTNPGGASEAWLVYLPEPSGIVLVLLGVAILAGRPRVNWRRK